MAPWGMTPHFTILVWGVPSSLPEWWDDIAAHMFTGRSTPHLRQPLCEIEVDTTTFDGDLTISRHRGLELRPQKMLTQHAN